jgi:hypothetical protein
MAAMFDPAMRLSRLSLRLAGLSLRLAGLSLAGLSLTALLLGATGFAQSQTQTLPPEEPTVAFSAEYRLEHNTGGRFDWGRRRIAVAGPLLRDELLDGDLEATTTLADRRSGLVLVFLPDDPERRLHRGNAQALPALALGYRSVVGALGPPRLAGQRQIAGQSCTVLVWDTPAEKQEWCITAQGIALAARRTAGPRESRSEVLVLELGPPDPGLFAPPAGFTPVDN